MEVKEILASALAALITSLAFAFIIMLCIGVFDDECYHEYVTTSEYDNEVGSYRVYSKCIECGDEI